MKKMNNKGFAITTLLYGLLSVAFLMISLLMGVMSQNRQNTTALVQHIEEDLNRYGETETAFVTTGDNQNYIVPETQSGWYKIELWGAKTTSGNGSYVSGTVYLNAGETLKFKVGNSCTSSCGVSSNSEVSYNGGVLMRAGGIEGNAYASGFANNVDAPSTAKYFVNGLRVDKINTGNGKATIKKVSNASATEYPTQKNNKFDNVRYIKYCAIGGTNKVAEIQARRKLDGKIISSNVACANNKNINESCKSTSGCFTITLNATSNLSEIGVWHQNGINYYNYSLAVSSNNSTWTYITNPNSSVTYTNYKKADSTGEHYSPWQLDPVDSANSELKSGSYYLFSVLYPTQVITADNSRVVSTANAKLSTFDGSKLQKWTIERVNQSDTNITTSLSKPIYRIFESENNNALQLQEDALEENTNISAHHPIRNFEWDLWYIHSLGDGTYKFQTILSVVKPYKEETSDYQPRFVTIDTGNSNNIVSHNYTSGTDEYRARFRIINAEY